MPATWCSGWDITVAKHYHQNWLSICITSVMTDSIGINNHRKWLGRLTSLPLLRCVYHVNHAHSTFCQKHCRCFWDTLYWSCIVMNWMSSIMSMTLYSGDSLVFLNNVVTTCYSWSHRLQPFNRNVRKMFLEVFSPFCYNNQSYTKQSGFPCQGSLLGWPLSLWSLQITVQFTPSYCSVMECGFLALQTAILHNLFFVFN